MYVGLSSNLFSAIRQSERFGPKTLHLMIRPQRTEGSFVELQRRIDALSSVNCELQITIRTNQTYHIIPHDLEWPLEKKNTRRKTLVKRLLWCPIVWMAAFFSVSPTESNDNQEPTFVLCACILILQSLIVWIQFPKQHENILQQCFAASCCCRNFITDNRQGTTPF